MPDPFPMLGDDGPTECPPAFLSHFLSGGTSDGVPAADLGPTGPSPIEMGSLDHYARLSRRLLRAPVSLVSIVEATRQIFPGAVGLGEPLMTSRETPIAYSFCQYVVEDEAPLVIEDARTDPRLRSNSAIREFDVIAYIGYPLTDEAGRTVGSVCAVDTVPRSWTSDDLAALRDLALACSAELQHVGRIAQDGEHLARALFTTTGIALVFYDRNDELVLANDPARHVAAVGGFRIDARPYGGPHAYRPDGLTRVPMHEQIIPRSLAGDLRNHELQWLGQPGKQIAISASAHRVTRSDGTPWGTLVALQDVTDLARAIQVKDDLIATVSHELRTPLTSILGYSELLIEEFTGAEGPVSNALAVIERAALSLQSRIDELLDSGVRQWALALETTDVYALAQRVAAAYAATAMTSSVELVVAGGTVCPAAVDAPRFVQVMENLLSNALKFTPHGGRVTLHVRTCEERVLVEVTDQGIGMTEDEISQAFDTFWRGGSARLQAIQGFGIGLTVVRSLVEAHHGTITITSKPGQGTIATIALPLVR